MEQEKSGIVRNPLVMYQDTTLFQTGSQVLVEQDMLLNSPKLLSELFWLQATKETRVEITVDKLNTLKPDVEASPSEPSMLKTMRVSELVSSWDDKPLQRLNKRDTYCVIFGVTQIEDRLPEKFHKLYEDTVNILFEDKAINGSQQHYGDRSIRQHIIIFEKK